jgi:hypothetical protein
VELKVSSIDENAVVKHWQAEAFGLITMHA